MERHARWTVASWRRVGGTCATRAFGRPRPLAAVQRPGRAARAGRAVGFAADRRELAPGAVPALAVLRTDRETARGDRLDAFGKNLKKRPAREAPILRAQFGRAFLSLLHFEKQKLRAAEHPSRMGEALGTR